MGICQSDHFVACFSSFASSLLFHFLCSPALLQVHPGPLLQILPSLAPSSLLLCSTLKRNMMKSYGAHGKQYNSVNITLSLTLVNPVN